MSEWQVEAILHKQNSGEEIDRLTDPSYEDLVKWLLSAEDQHEALIYITDLSNGRGLLRSVIKLDKNKLRIVNGMFLETLGRGIKAMKKELGDER